MMWHDKDRIQKQGGSVWGRYKGSSEFTSMPFAFLHVAAGSGKAVFPLLSGLFFSVISRCAYLWFAEVLFMPQLNASLNDPDVDLKQV